MLAWERAQSLPLLPSNRLFVSDPMRSAPELRLGLTVTVGCQTDEELLPCAPNWPPPADLIAASMRGEPAASATVAALYRRRLGPERTRQMDLLAGHLRLVGDQMEAEARRRREGGFLAVQLANGALFGAFAAIPLPQWAQDFLNWLRLF